ncbi:CCC1 [Histoplasma ohiense]|nr:CCC1 [Histoplasma ohiense (nom. inval.)]
MAPSNDGAHSGFDRISKSRSSNQDTRESLLPTTTRRCDRGGAVVNGGDPEAQNWGRYQTFPTCSRNANDTGSETQSMSCSKINPRIISDAILGLSDGLTVPFALSAGLSAFGNTKVVVLGSLAELVAGAISMGLGGYVGAKTEIESYETAKREVQELISACPCETTTMVREVFAPYSLPDHPVSEMSSTLHSSPKQLMEFLLAFHHKQPEPDANQALVSAITLALGYFIGGFIPLIPYILSHQVLTALKYSAGVMAVTLLVFGYLKTCIVRGWSGRENIIAGLKGGVQMVMVGGAAAGAAVFLVRMIDNGKM